MWLLIVNPISRGIPKEHLYYFSPEKVEEGDLIEVPLRSRNIVAKVDSVRAVIDAKSELKSLPFAIRKIGTISLPKFFSEVFMKASNDTALYFASSLGATLYSLLPPKRLLSALQIGFKKEETKTQSELSEAVYILQCKDEERFSAYRRMIREEFAKKKSVFMIVPTISDVVKIFDDISKGLEDYAYFLHQRLPKQKIGEIWKKASENNHPIFFVATPHFLGLPRADFGTIVIERESSSFYKKESRPFVDFRIFTKFFAKYSGAKLVLGDSMIRSETFYEFESGRFYEYAKASFRQISNIKTSIIIYDNKKSRQRNLFVSNEITDAITESKQKGERFFILSPRRGLSPRTFCRNCGKSVSCLSCGGALVLHGEYKKSVEDVPKYLCHRCGTEISSAIRCEACNSWDLVTFGAGSEKIEKELKETFPDIKIFRADRDVLKRETEIEKMVQKFLSTPGSVLIGTELILSRISENIENSAVLFPELLTTSPEYTTDEEGLRLLLRAKQLSSKNFFIQTADCEAPIVCQSENINLIDFYRKELETRQALNYPPFSVMILLSWKTSQEMKVQIEKLFIDFKPIVFSSWQTGLKKEDRALIRLKTNEWPNKILREKLMSLPLKVEVKVMPDRIFS